LKSIVEYSNKLLKDGFRLKTRKGA